MRVTVMGAGDIGKHAVEAATKYGNAERSDLLMRYGVPGVEVVTIGRNLTSDDAYLCGDSPPRTSWSTRRSGTTRPSRYGTTGSACFRRTP